MRAPVLVSRVRGVTPRHHACNVELVIVVLVLIGRLQGRCQTVNGDPSRAYAGHATKTLAAGRPGAAGLTLAPAPWKIPLLGGIAVAVRILQSVVPERSRGC